MKRSKNVGAKIAVVIAAVAIAVWGCVKIKKGEPVFVVF